MFQEFRRQPDNGRRSSMFQHQGFRRHRATCPKRSDEDEKRCYSRSENWLQEVTPAHRPNLLGSNLYESLPSYLSACKWDGQISNCR